MVIVSKKKCWVWRELNIEDCIVYGDQEEEDTLYAALKLSAFHCKWDGKLTLDTDC